MGWVVKATPQLLYPGKEDRYLFYRRLGWLQCWPGRVQKISPPPGCDPRTVQLVVSQYTDYAIPAVFELGVQHNAPTSLSSGKDRIPIVQEALWA